MSAAIASLYRAAAAAVRNLEAAKRELRTVWVAARAPSARLTICIARCEIAADRAAQALDTVIGLELLHDHECREEARVVREGLRWGDVLELHAHAAALDEMADHFDTAPAAAPVES